MIFIDLMTLHKFEQEKLIGRTSQLIQDLIQRQVTSLSQIPLFNRDNKITKSTVDIQFEWYPD